MRIKLDENLGRNCVMLLERAGHDVATVVDQGLCSADDPTVAGVCQEEGRCLVTLDLGFANPFVYLPADYPGIAVLRLPSKPEPEDVIAGMHTLIRALEDRDPTGKLWIVQKGRFQEYQPEEGEA